MKSITKTQFCESYHQYQIPIIEENKIKDESKEIDSQNSKLMSTSINHHCQDTFSPIQERSLTKIQKRHSFLFPKQTPGRDPYKIIMYMTKLL
ncbi:unnamed protein product (macronuclear) [Paramecium tetraurelia]|uniref:Uncharacterized protein n=1 Tax=Paramecium tetraurelia TaxID=5888 RepID=A0D161_PARTE|nr:uncharacterized protein GSPATT00012302001 [Paramecium tetraurelia]CAK76778.1 unnamed protein product [Paramecium tetraurelia]|eukprot:XP_001444175.1 hypothetical protein (macronuclear) [Paramecium tetraurelia strain d4-2]